MARAMRRVSTRSPSTIPASMPGLTEEQLQSGNVSGTGVRDQWKLGIGRWCQSSGGGVERLGKGQRWGGLWEVGREIARSRPTCMGLNEAET